MTRPFQLFLFSTDTEFTVRAVSSGVDGLVVDWENIGKRSRQVYADTQVNYDTVDDLRRVRACTDALVICRINSYGATTAREVECAIAAGADEILLPMVRSPENVETVLKWVSGRCGTGILVETEKAVQRIEQLAQLPLSRVYVGLNDLGIQRNYANIFTAIVDGTVERLRRACDAPFGFGGLTLPDRGFPIPCRLLIGEMVRLECDFSFLRRSFLADIRGHKLAHQVPRLRSAIAAAGCRTDRQIARDRTDLYQAIVHTDLARPK